MKFGVTLCLMTLSGCVWLDDFGQFSFDASVDSSVASVDASVDCCVDASVDAAVLAADAGADPDARIDSDAREGDVGADASVVLDASVADGQVGDAGFAPDAVAPDDAASPQPDAGPADTGEIDSGPALTCSDPCVGDAVLDFDPAMQNTGPLSWGYMKDTRGASGLTFVDMAPGTYHGISVWADGSPPPAIGSCALSSAAADCAGLRDSLLFVTDAPGAGGDPVLTLTAPSDTTYELNLRYRQADGAIGTEPFEVLVSRNTRSNLIARSRSAPTTVEEVFTTAVDVLAGDRLMFMLRPLAGAAGAAQIGVDVRVSRDLNGPPLSECMFAARFDDSNPLLDSCGGRTLDNSAETGGTPSVSTNGPLTWMGQARDLDRRAYISAPGAFFDYSGDFTVDMWVRIDSNSYWDTAIYSDWSAYDAATAGGVALELDPEGAVGTMTAQFLFPDPGGINTPNVACSSGYCTGTIVGVLRNVGQWHHYRITRHTQTGDIRYCVDGELQGTANVPVGTDLSNPRSPTIGTWGTLAQPTFDGDIDDLVILRRALPCGP